MYRLAEILSVPIHSAVGLMEMLRHFAGEFTPAGDIGSLPDKEIAHGVSWDGDPALLVFALVDARWLDRSEAHRLVIHDWPEHCENSVAKKLRYRKKGFLPEYKIFAHFEKNGGETSANSPASREAEAEASEEELKKHKPSVRENSLTVVPPQNPEHDPECIVAAICAMYTAGGLPVPVSTRTYAVRMLTGMPPERRMRLPRYVKMCFETGRWGTVRTTKAFSALLSCDEWDVDLTPRVIPNAREPSKGESEAVQRMLAQEARLKRRFGEEVRAE